MPPPEHIANNIDGARFGFVAEPNPNNVTYPDEADDVVPEVPSHWHDHNQRQVPSPHYHYCTDEHCRGDPDVYRVHTTDTATTCDSLTTSNRTGAGRAIGQIYSALGRRLERTANRLAHKAGYGPRAAAARICELNYTIHDVAEHLHGDHMQKKLQEVKDAQKRLVGYLSYVTI